MGGTKRSKTGRPRTVCLGSRRKRTGMMTVCVDSTRTNWRLKVSFRGVGDVVERGIVRVGNGLVVVERAL